MERESERAREREESERGGGLSQLLKSERGGARAASPQMSALPSMPASWPLYFGEDYVADDRRALLTAELAGFMAGGGWPQLRAGAAVAPGRRFVAVALDYAALASGSGSPDLVASLEVQPTEGLACIAAAAHEVSGERERERERNCNSLRVFFFFPPDPTTSLPPPRRSFSTPAPPTAPPPWASPPPPRPPPPWRAPASGLSLIHI